MAIGDYNGHVGLGVKCSKEVLLLSSSSSPPLLMHLQVVTKARALVSEGGALYYIGCGVARLPCLSPPPSSPTPPPWRCGASAAPSTTLVAWAPSSPSPQRNMEVCPSLPILLLLLLHFFFLLLLLVPLPQCFRFEDFAK